MHKLYEDDELAAFVELRDRAFLFVTFSPFGSYDLDHPWGMKFIAKNNRSVVSFVAKRANWYPDASMQRAAAELHKLRTELAPNSRVIHYGHSMGGYAAIRYSRLLGADEVFAYSPQISIDPRDTGSFDTRYTSHYNPAMHSGMRIQKTHLGNAQLRILLDPFSHEDLGHVKRLAAVMKLEIIRMPFMQHSPPVFFAETGTGSSLLEICCSSEATKGASLRQLIRASRHRSESYLSGLENALTKSKHTVFLKKFSHLFTVGNIRSDTLIKRGVQHLRLGDEAKAVSLLRQAKNREIDSPAILKSLSSAFIEAKHPSDALECLERAHLIEPGNIKIKTHFIKLLQEQGVSDRALSLAKSISISTVDDMSIARSLASFWQQTDHQENCLAAFRKALELRPQDESNFIALAGYYERRKATNMAVATLEQGLALHPTSQLLTQRVERLRQLATEP